MWDNPESRYLYTVVNFTREVPTISRVWDLLGYDGRQVVQGFTRVSEERITTLVGEKASIESALFMTDAVEPSKEEIERERTELEETVEDEPQLTEDSERYVRSRRRARDAAFGELIRDVYEGSCAVCGSQRETPDGNPEVEAAHIYPKRKGGSDDVRNGLALCKLHHWAFDSGWISVTDEHGLLVADAPEKNGYHEFKQLEDKLLELPDNERVRPDPLFLTEHREINGF